MNTIQPADRLIFPLDVSSADEARRFVKNLDGVVSFFKVGIELQMVTDLNFVRELTDKGKKVFLDYKYFDVAETVKRAVERVANVGVTFLTVHGASQTIQAAVAGRGNSGLKILCVTVLTSLDAHDLADMGYTCSVEELVLHRTRTAMKAGCDGVITSGLEAQKIRDYAQGGLLIVTPGIRPEDMIGTDDQKRAVTPTQAIKAGADYLVVGRPIRRSPDPRGAAEKIIDEITQTLEEIDR